MARHGVKHRVEALRNNLVAEAPTTSDDDEVPTRVKTAVLSDTHTAPRGGFATERFELAVKARKSQLEKRMFSVTDVGKTIEIRQGRLYFGNIDMSRRVKHADYRGKIVSVEPEPCSSVRLDNGAEFENPAQMSLGDPGFNAQVKHALLAAVAAFTAADVGRTCFISSDGAVAVGDTDRHVHWVDNKPPNWVDNKPVYAEIEAVERSHKGTVSLKDGSEFQNPALAKAWAHLASGCYKKGVGAEQVAEKLLAARLDTTVIDDKELRMAVKLAPKLAAGDSNAAYELVARSLVAEEEQNRGLAEHVVDHGKVRLYTVAFGAGGKFVATGPTGNPLSLASLLPCIRGLQMPRGFMSRRQRWYNANHQCYKRSCRD